MGDKDAEIPQGCIFLNYPNHVFNDPGNKVSGVEKYSVFGPGDGNYDEPESLGALQVV
jgi:hypothetical protein